MIVLAVTTPNYNLTKQLNSEKVNVALINANMDIIDSALNELAESTSSSVTINSISTEEIQNLFN